MSTPSSTSRRIARLFAALLALTLLAQFICYVHDLTLYSLASAMLTYLSFFTLLTNSLVLLALLAHATSSPKLKFFNRPPIQAAILTYILAVDLIFAIILRAHAGASGLQLLLDILLHDLCAPAFLLFWYRFLPHGELRLHHPLLFLIYPLAFLPYNALLSSLTGRNPYPFLDAATLGLPRYLLAITALSATFLTLGFILYFLDRRAVRKPSTMTGATH